MKLKEGDALFDPMSRNSGEVKKIISHPNGKLVTIRWTVDDHLPHDTEHFYNKIVKSIKKGEIQHTPSSET